MKVILEAVGGPALGRKIEVHEGKILRIGRTESSDFPLPEDAYLSKVHFAVGCDGKHCLVRDMGSSNGTFVNGARIAESAVTEQDQIVAGGSTFSVLFEHEAERTEPGSDLGRTMSAPIFKPALTAVPTRIIEPLQEGQQAEMSGADRWPAFSKPHKRLLAALFRDDEPVYALLDPLRDNRIASLVIASGEPQCSLYDGQPEVDPPAAPYLVMLSPASRLLEPLLNDGWGKSWGLYLASRAHPEQVRAHLRDYLVLRTETGKGLCFPFDDPIIFRVLTERGTPRECTRFFGPITRFLTEAENASAACEVRDTTQGAVRHIINLEESGAAPAV
jgi:hypothetical protein